MYSSTLEDINKIINNPYKLTKEGLRQKIVEIQSEIDKQKQRQRDLLEYELDNLLSILGQY
jgi:hypothetical protein